MIYLDNGATSLRKPPLVRQAVMDAMLSCANPGRSAHEAAMAAAKTVYQCRETAGRFFDCAPEQVVFTSNCTHGLNIAIRTLVRQGSRVGITGFEHNAVLRPLYALGAEIRVIGSRLFDWENVLQELDAALKQGLDAAVFTHVSNVFGYILPIGQMVSMCHDRGVPVVIDGAQSAGSIALSFQKLAPAFLAVPGHKGLLGPQGTGLLLCGESAQPLLYGGTGSESANRHMPEELPERLEAGTLNVPGIAGLDAGMRSVQRMGIRAIHERECRQVRKCVQGLQEMGLKVFSGAHQAGTVSFLPGKDCEEAARVLAKQGIAVRSGLHCAPLAHKSAGTFETGTLRVSYGYDACDMQTHMLLKAISKGIKQEK